MKTTISVCLILIMTISVTSVKAQEITVVTEEWPPFNFTLDNGEVGGMAAKIVRAALDEAGMDYKIGVYPWARAYNMALKKPNVLIYSIFRSEQREKMFQWICPISPQNNYYLFKLGKRSDIIVRSLEDAKKYKIGVMRNDRSHEFFLTQGFEENEQLDIVSREELNIRKLLRGRIDLIVQGELSLSERMRKLGIPYDEFEKTLLIYKGDAGSNCMAFGPKTSEALVERIRKALQKINAQGIIESTMNDYLEGK